jgi:hypothetical protein
MVVVITAMSTRMVNSWGWMMPALSPTFRAMSSVRPLVLTSAATVADWRVLSPVARAMACSTGGRLTWR